MENLSVFFVALGGLSLVGLVLMPVITYLKENEDFVQLIVGDLD
jgi:hypothetical protein